MAVAREDKYMMKQPVIAMVTSDDTRVRVYARREIIALLGEVRIFCVQPVNFSGAFRQCLRKTCGLQSSCPSLTTDHRRLQKPNKLPSRKTETAV